MPIISGGSSSSSSVVKSAKVTRTAGSLTLNTNSAWAELAAATGGPGTGGFDLTLAAKIGDVIMVGINALVSAVAVGLSFDVATMVSGSPVNYVGGSGGNFSNSGIVGWFCNSAQQSEPGPPILYAVVSGDLSGGNVVLRPYYATTSATNRTLSATAASPFQIWACNLLH